VLASEREIARGRESESARATAPLTPSLVHATQINNRQHAFRVRGADGTEELLLFGVPGKGDLNATEPAAIATEFAASLGLPIKRLICQVRNLKTEP